MKRLFLLIMAICAIVTPARAAPIDDAQRRDISIPAGDVLLAATLYRPRGATGDLPAMIIAHGSEPSTRQMVGGYTNVGLRMGFAVLAFDKRGTGNSTGSYEPVSVENSARIFEDLAMDLVHSARWLVDQPGIDQARIGLLGASQAGWIMPLAASRERRLSFIVAASGVPLSAGQADVQQAYLNAVNDPRVAGFPLRQVFAADVAALDYYGPPGFDPGPILQSLETPTLWIFGLFDVFIPTLPSIERIGELQRAGRRNHAIRVLPFGDHNFRNEFTGELYDPVEVIAPWLRDIGVIR